MVTTKKDPYPPLQIVNRSQNFDYKLSSFIEQSWKLDKTKLDYHVVSIFGPQGTGKSTLLNKLFGTTFEVEYTSMGFSLLNKLFGTSSDGMGTSQTTEGIWMSRAKDLPILVMDVEVNLSASSDMSILKTIFQASLELFQNQKRKQQRNTLIIIAIRDYDGQVPFEKLKESLYNNIKEIWKGLNKPDGLDNCAIHEFFDFMVMGLSHAVDSSKKFDKEIAGVQHWFTDMTHRCYVFQSKYHKGIPAEGYGDYAGDIWKQIYSNKKLDLPARQELLAEFHCNKISNAVLKQFTKETRFLKACILEKEEIVDDLSNRIHKIRFGLMKKYNQTASVYYSETYERMGKELLNALNLKLKVFFLGQLVCLHTNAIKTFTIDIQKHSSNNNTANEIYILRKRVENQFVTCAEDKLLHFVFKEILLANTDWSYQYEYSQLTNTLDELSKSALINNIKKFLGDCEEKGNPY
ncbi:root hair defective 3 GTP-binding protein-domain-containing protein [Circinella umbellata]|nr:root hair defective 3 GTP-binding protein-domain-containing protein [Circinella umbellata]